MSMISFMEVTRFDKAELERLKTLTYWEIQQQFTKYFCIPDAEVDLSLYAEIIPYCERIQTADGEVVWVAKCRYCRQMAGISYYLLESFEEGEYADITELSGELLEGTKKIANQNFVIQDKMPVVPWGSRLFYQLAK